MPATGYGSLIVPRVHTRLTNCIEYRLMNAAAMKKTGNCTVWNTAGSFFGVVFLGMIAGLMPVGHELLARGAADSHVDGSRRSLAANDLQTANQAQAAGSAFEAGWRYTKDGWQNRTLWEKPAPVSKPALHPAIVATFQLLLCLAVLIGCSASKRRYRV